jgi:hypothetical protein
MYAGVKRWRGTRAGYERWKKVDGTGCEGDANWCDSEGTFTYSYGTYILNP